MIVTSKRLESIDILRGLIIVVMALDHTREYWAVTGFDLTDLHQTTATWFMMRWVSHFCAPLFVFLTGVSAFLYGQKAPSRGQLQKFMLTRGIWLIFLELVVVNLSRQFGYQYIFLHIIWAIGISLILLALMLYLPLWGILLVNVPFILFHNAFNDQSMLALFGGADWLWKIFHVNGVFLLKGTKFPIHVDFPLVPIFSVLALGYCAGHLYLQPARLRQRCFIWGGLIMIVIYLFLRLTNLYGDPILFDGSQHWLLSLLDTTKYPLSLQFLLMTIGPGLIVLALLEKVNLAQNRYLPLRWLHVFGSVPLFFFILHVPVINAAAQLYTYLVYGRAINFFTELPGVFPSGYEASMMLAFFVWVSLLLVMYLPCKYYGHIKRHSNIKWRRALSYL
ncbi:DUF1624 domain-containing protein [Candidatus Sororendozoicomonas aggregata]|uniref:DUF1624 domain-containing protein n=1 Tax=Candidatus Sororendozoicomonas aggregata TaxID=3073239 RepID=UPI002ED250BF